MFEKKSRKGHNFQAGELNILNGLSASVAGREGIEEIFGDGNKEVDAVYVTGHVHSRLPASSGDGA